MFICSLFAQKAIVKLHNNCLFILLRVSLIKKRIFLFKKDLLGPTKHAASITDVFGLLYSAGFLNLADKNSKQTLHVGFDIQITSLFPGFLGPQIVITEQHIHHKRQCPGNTVDPDSSLLKTKNETETKQQDIPSSQLSPVSGCCQSGL